MKRNSRSILLLVFTAVLGGAAFGQTKQHQRNLTVNGQNGTAEVIDQNGRLFVEVSALASIGKGSVSYSGPGIVLTFPSSQGVPSLTGIETQPWPATQVPTEQGPSSTEQSTGSPLRH